MSFSPVQQRHLFLIPPSPRRRGPPERWEGGWGVRSLFKIEMLPLHLDRCLYVKFI